LCYPMEIVPPTSVKKFGASYGFAKKEAMIDALPKDVREYFLSLGVKKTTGLSDLADAYFIAKMYYRDVV